jgi:hypothetical protein
MKEERERLIEIERLERDRNSCVWETLWGKRWREKERERVRESEG